MNLLFIGDVVSSRGCDFIRSRLPALKKELRLDFVIANGENSADTNGIVPKSAEHLFDSGVDCITGGNHSYRRREIYEYMDRESALLRPANFYWENPGHGFTILERGKYRLCVVNLIGTVYMQPAANPFVTIDRILEETDCKTILVDFHAEASAEKAALAHYLDGRVTAVLGTHTHVQTADACILPKGTAFITDVGMVGPRFSILGVKPEIAIRKMKTNMPVRFEYSNNPVYLNSVLIEINDTDGKITKFEPFNII